MQTPHTPRGSTAQGRLSADNENRRRHAAKIAAIRAAKAAACDQTNGKLTSYSPPLTDANGAPVPITRYPTKLDLRCAACGHRATASLFLDQVPKLKCSRCGCRDVQVAGRSPLTSWASRRLKGNALSSNTSARRPRG